jgi:hypothetical protein
MKIMTPNRGFRCSSVWNRKVVPVLVALVGVGLLASACGSGAASSGVASIGSTTSTTTPAGSSGGAGTAANGSKLVAYAQCVRAHGVPNFPDPNSSGELNLSGLSSTELGAINKTNAACLHLMPANDIGHTSPPTAKELKYAQCIRAHGFPNWPEPSANGTEMPPADAGINESSPQFQAANKACQ